MFQVIIFSRKCQYICEKFYKIFTFKMLQESIAASMLVEEVRQREGSIEEDEGALLRNAIEFAG